jgi:NTE family protein
MKLSADRPIALALSGGGIRAMVFHLGVLKFLAEHGVLERVRRISSVSGGSLVTGLVYERSGGQWPTSSQFLQEIYDLIRQELCSKSMQLGALRQLIFPTNWRYLLSRANLLAGALRREWRVTSQLSALPATPEWSINGTTAENGRRFRFKHNSIGDYRTGDAVPGKFPLANALAVSAAFPGGFGPLSLPADRFKWMKRPWGAPEGSEEHVSILYRVLHLYDGGVYDNLGLESFFDAGRGISKYPDHIIVVSDAGKALRNGLSAGPLNPFRLMRVADIMSDQSHALRVRTFINYLLDDPERGALISIEDNAPSLNKHARDFASSFPTTLRRLTEAEFDQLAQHGYGVANIRLSDHTHS